jgi:thiol-disulfide isomerase/thioredoxin
VPDIRDTKAIGKLMSLLNKKNIVLIFIYADWCPHCHTYRDNVWNKLKTVPGRNMAMAAVNSDVADSALNGFIDSETRQPARADGFPTVMIVENGTKEAVKIPSPRNLPAMERLVNNADKLPAAGAPPAPVANNKRVAPAPVVPASNIVSPNNRRENTVPIETYSESIEGAANTAVKNSMEASSLAPERPIKPVSPLKFEATEDPLDIVEPPATGVVQRGGSLLQALKAYERANRNRNYDLQ